MNDTIMKAGSIRKIITLLIVTALIGSAVLLSGCPDRVSGTQTGNKKPVVYFVNVPPADYKTSRNPLLYWVGSDPDGQVKMFRYIVVLASALGGTPERYITDSLPKKNDSMWVSLSVDDVTPDPQAGDVIRMSAALVDPVNVFVPQWVFLQAFDEKGLGSDIVFRMYQRNDNPPQTTIHTLDYSFPNNPFINAKQAGGAITGVRLSWAGEDKLDYPAAPPPFEFQWKLLGPYAFDTLTGGEYKLVLDRFMKKVFVSVDSKVYRLGQNIRLPIKFRDSLDTSADPDTVILVPYDTLSIDTMTGSNSYGTLDSMLLIDSLLADTLTPDGLGRLVDTSAGGNNGWISATSDTLYDLYRYQTSLTQTTEGRFIMWVRSRDDANVPDVVPNILSFNVIEPKYERDILVVDFAKVFFRENAPAFAFPPPPTRAEYFAKDTTFQYWKARIHDWNPQVNFDTLDYYILNARNDDIPLKDLLRYKLVILYNDDVAASNIMTGADASIPAKKIYKALDGGVNVWLMMRAPGAGQKDTKPTQISNPIRPDAQYQRYFGVAGLIYSGWWKFAVSDLIRIEDFVGAYSLDTTQWPDLEVDTAQLHGRYAWGGLNQYGDTPHMQWIDTIGALPEVGWASRHFGTTALYLYKSRYGGSHPLGPNSSYEGSPVAIRYQTSLFRTAHFSFTPMGIKDSQMQIVINDMLNWLYPGTPPTAAPVTVDRYPNAAVRLSVSDIQRNDAQRAVELKAADDARTSSMRW